ncbi:MAG: PKD domain-containing protein, partial [Cytophagia bacterium]|nr:PKD domain-containing protein [Cytophagia bacterium]
MRLAKELILLRIKILLNSIHMKKFIKFLAFTLAMSSFAMFQSCDEEDPLVQPTVTEPSTIASVQVGGSGDVTFTFEYDAVNPNIVRFTNTSAIGFKPIWDFGNGVTSTENQVTVPYPVEGNYNVKLTLLTAGGIANSTQVVNIAE